MAKLLKNYPRKQKEAEIIAAYDELLRGRSGAFSLETSVGAGRLADQMGTIDDIGLGSTRVRTLNDTVVTIPNAKVSQMSLEN